MSSANQTLKAMGVVDHGLFLFKLDAQSSCISNMYQQEITSNKRGMRLAKR